MSLELTLLLASTVLALTHVSVQSFLRKAEVGIRHDVGARDVDPPLKGVLQGRAERALRNFLETYPVFIALVVVAELSGASDGWTQAGAALYVGFRVIYLPLYLLGTPWLRTFSWNIASAGLALMIIGALV